MRKSEYPPAQTGSFFSRTDLLTAADPPPSYAPLALATGECQSPGGGLGLMDNQS